jgi:hypothetical protein
MILRCVTCGEYTEWDDRLGDDPYCVTHWDRRSEATLHRDNRAYLRNIPADRRMKTAP